MLICCKSPKYILPSLLMFLLFSPLWFNALGLSFIILNIIPLIYFCLYLISRKEIKISKNLAIILATLITICFISFVMSPNPSFILNGLINFLIVCFIIVLAYDYVKKGKSLALIELTMIFAGIGVTSIILVAFFYRINLSDFLMFSSGVVSEVNYIVYFFPKGTYFYNNVFYVLGLSLIITFSYICSKKQKLLPVLIFLYIFIGMLFLFNKSGMGALILALCYCMYTCRQYISKVILIAVVLMFGLAAFSIFSFIIYFQGEGASSVNHMLSFSSLLARLSILERIWETLAIGPKYLFFGTGPDSLIRIPHESSPFITLVKTSQNALEGTLDSAFFSYFVEFGVFFIFIYSALMISGIFLGLKKYAVNATSNSFGDVYNYGGACFVYVLICGTTQVLSIGKISWIVYFILSSILFALFKAKRAFISVPLGNN